MEYSGKIIKLDNRRIVIDTNEDINIERLKTLYFGYQGHMNVEVTISDPRKFSKQQRLFYYAVLGDIYRYTGESVEILDEFFKNRYTVLTGASISLSNHSQATMEEVGKLCDIVIAFVLEWNIPFKNGYEIPPQNTEWFLYKCLTERKCCLCGKKADIHHATHLVGMGNNRKKHDHINSSFMALCREHHNLIHNIGLTEFMKRYNVFPVKLNNETIKRLNI